MGEIHGRGTDLAAPGGAARMLGDGGGDLETKAPRRGDFFFVLVWNRKLSNFNFLFSFSLFVYFDFLFGFQVQQFSYKKSN